MLRASIREEEHPGEEQIVFGLASRDSDSEMISCFIRDKLFRHLLYLAIQENLTFG